MRTLLKFIAVAILILGISFPKALYATKSTITGTVIDSRTKQPLPGANVYIAGTSVGAASNLEGKFYISNIPPGRYTLVVDYIGYKQKQVEVELLEQRQTVSLTFELEYVALELGKTIEVTAQAEGQMEAINKQLSARQIVNVVASDRIQELPDANAAESVNRLPGVSVLREGGEGTKIVIRGLSPKYNTVMIEGVQISPTDYNERSTDLSMISPYMLEGIEVMKAITPDQDADAIGGSVNFQIQEAKEGLGVKGSRFGYDFIARGGYNGLKGTYDDYKLVGEVSTRFLNSRLGILAQVDIEKRNRSAHQMNASYELHGPSLDTKNDVFINGLSVFDINREKERLGGAFVADYRLPNGKIALKNIFSRANTDAISYQEYYEYTGNHHNYSTYDESSQLDMMVNILKFEQRFSVFKFDAHVAHSYSENDAPLNVQVQWKERGGAYTEINQDAHPSEIPSYAKNNINQTMLYECWDNSYLAKDRQITAAANLEMSYSLTKQMSGKLKIGGKYRSSDREYDQQAAGGYLWVGGARQTRQNLINAFPWIIESPLIPDAASFFWMTPFLEHAYESYKMDDNFLDGEYEIGPVFDVGLMRDMMKVVRQSNELDTYHQNDVSSKANDYSGTEFLGAGYIMTDLNIGSMVTVIPGVRYEQLRTSYYGIQGDSRPRDAEFRYKHTDTTIVRTRGHWLPMAHVRFKPVKWFDVRFAYTNTLSRPDYNLITPNSNISTGMVSWKNYNLKPMRSENFDLYLSFHQNHIGLFTVGGFVKNIRDMIYNTQSVIFEPSIYGLPAIVRNYDINFFENNPNEAKVRGIEIDWQTTFWYLPGLLRGLVFNTNYTHIFSEAKYPQYKVTTEYDENYNLVKTYHYFDYRDRMLHQPNDIVNASLGYDYKNFSVRMSMLYQSNIFKQTYYYPEGRVTTDDYLRFDISISQNLPWYGLQLYCNINNLNAAHDVDLNRGNGFPTAIQHYGRTMDLGVRWTY